jgi:hypothetical protein
MKIIHKPLKNQTGNLYGISSHRVIVRVAINSNKSKWIYCIKQPLSIKPSFA